MHLLLIDDRGELWSETCNVIRTSFASAYADDGFSAYLVKNLGFIAIDIYGQSCQVRVRPALVSQETFEALIKWLAHNRYERLALGYFDNDWHLELHATPDLLAHRLLKLINVRQLARPKDFMAEYRGADALTDNPELRGLVENWHRLSSKLENEETSRLLKQITNGRYMIVRHSRDSGRFTITEFGTGYVAYTKNWSQEAKGIPLERQPDREYGRFAVDGYRRSLEANAPYVDDVDAIISTAKYGRYRVRYRRLIIPGARTEDGDDLLLSSSVLDERIDLRAKVVNGG